MSRMYRLAITVPAILALMNVVLLAVAAAGDAGPCLPVYGC